MNSRTKAAVTGMLGSKSIRNDSVMSAKVRPECSAYASSRQRTLCSHPPEFYSDAIRRHVPCASVRLGWNHQSKWACVVFG